MSITMILRTPDPAVGVALLGDLGVTMEAPDPLHPDAWRGFLTMHVEVMSKPSGAPELSIGTEHAAMFAEALARRGAKIETPASRSQEPSFVATGVMGERIVIEQREDRPWRSALDDAGVGGVRRWLDQRRDEILRMLRDVGASRPRLVGPVSMRRRPGDDFTLLVDGCDDRDLAPVNAFLAEMRSGPVGVHAASSGCIGDVDRDRLDRIAYPL